MTNIDFNKKTEAYLVSSKYNRLYFTGTESSFGFVLLSSSGNIFYTDARYFLEAEKKIKSGFSVKKVTSETALEEVYKDLTERGIKKLGFEGKEVTVFFHKKLKEALKGISLVCVSSDIENLRIIKTEEEIEKITRAAKITSLAFDKILDHIKAGITERELYATVITECAKLGACDMAFNPVIAFSENSSVPHHSPTDKRLEKNSSILLDFGVKINGYRSDLTRTVYLGEPSEKFKGVYDIILSAQNYVLRHIKPGLSCHEVDLLAREYIKANGYKAEFSHALGHGVGLEIHEKPFIKHDNPEMLLPGMVVTIEPGVYLENEFGIRIEDTVVILENGIKNLSSANKQLITV